MIIAGVSKFRSETCGQPFDTAFVIIQVTSRYNGRTCFDTV